MLQHIAQGACQALENALDLADAIAGHRGNVSKAFAAYPKIVFRARLVCNARPVS